QHHDEGRRRRPVIPAGTPVPAHGGVAGPRLDGDAAGSDPGGAFDAHGNPVPRVPTGPLRGVHCSFKLRSPVELRGRFPPSIDFGPYHIEPMSAVLYGRGIQRKGWRLAASLFSRVLSGVGNLLDRRYGWDKLPLPLGILTLAGVRETLRAKNLVDTNTPGVLPKPATPPPADLQVPSTAGTYNDLQSPEMGAVDARFGRNVPLDRVFPESEPGIMSPNPRTVSRVLLTRDAFQPATIINLLVPAWLQFMVHDWMSHGSNESEHPWVVALEDADPWPYRPMTIPRTRVDPSRSPEDDGLPPTYTNTETHWWDASQVYGSDPNFGKLLRSGEDGKVNLDARGL